MDKIEKIRQEIERRRHDYGKRMLQPDGMVARAKFDELTGLLAFIDSLPEEHFRDSTKMISEGLEEEMDRFFEEMSIQEHENIFEDTFQMIARHFAEWGRMRFRDTEKSQNEISENIGYLMKKTAAQAYVAQLVLNGKVPDGLIISPLREIAENAFIYGAEWGAKHLK